MTLIEPIIAGMPALLPWDSEPSPIVSQPFSRQVQLLVGSVIVLMLAALVIQWLWNSLTTDFESMPKMSYLRSLGMCSLWGLAMVIALILIDGTRHTFSPSAWVRNGFTYRLTTEDELKLKSYREKRQTNLENLFNEVEQFRARNDGNLPANLSEIDSIDIEVPGANGLKYFYNRNNEQASYQILEPRLLDDIRYAVNEKGEVIEWQDE